MLAVPPKGGDGVYGVYPDTARNALKIQGTRRAGEPLPWADWAQEFAETMPTENATVLVRAGLSDSSGSICDPKWKDRLIDRFGRRWRTIRYILDRSGLHRVYPIQNPLNLSDRSRSLPWFLDF